MAIRRELSPGPISWRSPLSTQDSVSCPKSLPSCANTTAVTSQSRPRALQTAVPGSPLTRQIHLGELCRALPAADRASVPLASPSLCAAAAAEHGDEGGRGLRALQLLGPCTLVCHSATAGACSPCSQPGTGPGGGTREAASPTANEAWGQAMKSCS